MFQYIISYCLKKYGHQTQEDLDQIVFALRRNTMRYHLQANYEKKRLKMFHGYNLISEEDYKSSMTKVNDILSMDESQIILSYGKDPFGLNYLSEYGLKSFIEMK